MLNRRQLLERAGAGFGLLALNALLAEQGLQADEPNDIQGRAVAASRAMSPVHAIAHARRL